MNWTNVKVEEDQELNSCCRLEAKDFRERMLIAEVCKSIAVVAMSINEWSDLESNIVDSLYMNWKDC